ncbi:MAG: ArsR/SmtB family transcription factor [Candidatus Thorarchaeota archaeon]
MTRDYVERVENLQKFCKEVPEKAPCCVPYETRLEAMEKFVESFSPLSSTIFSAGIRTGIVLFLYRIGEACVCEFQAALNEERQPLVSHHLRQLRESGCLHSERRGRWTYYSLSDDCRKAVKKFVGVMKEV